MELKGIEWQDGTDRNGAVVWIMELPWMEWQDRIHRDRVAG